MVKKALFGSGVFLFLAITVFLGMNGEDSPDLTADFEQAEQYVEAEKYGQAEAIYQAIITDYPGSDDALKAQEKLTILYIQWDKEPEAEAAFEELVTNYSEHEGIAKAVDHVADEYRNSDQYEKARDYYQYVLDNWPEAEHAIGSHVGAALSNILLLIQLGDDTGTEAALDNLIADFSEYKDIAKAVEHVADGYRNVGEYDKAGALYQYIVDTWPDAEHVTESQMGAVLSDTLQFIQSGDDGAVHEAISGLIADFNDHRGLPRVVFQVGEGYYNNALWYKNEGFATEAAGCFAKAAGVWERIITELPTSDLTTHAFYSSAYCLAAVGEYQSAIQYYEKVADDWPDFKYAWNAQFMVGRSYQALKDEGAISKSEADLKTKIAYKQLLKKYPNCKAARHARRWLSRHNRR